MRHFVIICILVWLFTTAPLIGILGTIAYVYWLNRKSSETKDNDANRQLKSGDLADLTILRLEIDRLRQQDVLSTSQAEAYRHRIDGVITQYLAECAAEPDNRLWWERREKAWSLLERYADIDLGPPPWQQEDIDRAETESVTPPTVVEQWQQEPEPIDPVSEPFADTEIVEVKEETETIDPICLSEQAHLNEQAEFAQVALDDAGQSDSAAPEPAVIDTITPTSSLETESPSLQIAANESYTIDSVDQTMKDYAWQPKEPGALEKMLTALSGWHALAAPFLLQNIGWFIGVFCFIAGSVFLVSYSSGYAKNLLAFITLFIFTLFSLWGGYQIRRKRPELKTSSHVIFILSMLLIPLVTTTVINLLINSGTITVNLFGIITWVLNLKWISGFLMVMELTTFYYAVTVVSALMDRSLQRQFPRFFLGLNVSQLLLLALAIWPDWPVAMLAHLAVFCILSLGIHAFIHDWLQAIFLDRRKITYFAAGTLIYAALIAFINFTWGTDEDISFPAGYSGFFLMLLCGLLFYVDSHFKQWSERQAYLSRFSFMVYGLSLLALFIEMPQQSMAIPTLCLAIALYAFVVWHYLTLTPLYIFLLCSFWLYGLLILQHFRPELHFMLACPGLYALYRSAKWALTVRRCRRLAIIVYRMLYGGVAVLVAWSLFHSERGWLGLGNVLLACWLLYFSLASAPVWLFRPRVTKEQSLAVDSYRNLLLTSWFYVIPLMWILAVFYVPIAPRLQEEVQLGFTLMLLTIYWTYSGLRLFINGNRATPPRLIEMRLNAALLCWLMALLYAVAMSVIPQCLSLFAAGATDLWLCLMLRLRWLFYLTMACWAITGMLIKAHYFPAPSTGLVEMLTALSIWALLWWLERYQDEDIVRLQQEAETARAERLPSFRLLWFCPVNTKQEFSDDS